jgi:cation diffusion facilitator family transporter
MHEHAAPELGNVCDTAVDARRAERRTLWVVGLTAATMVAELVAGWLTNSLALLADGWHMATHVGALGLASLGYWYARTRAGRGLFAFGTGKVYALSGYTSAVGLATASVWMAIEAVLRLARPEPIAFAEALPVAVLGLAVNVASVALLHHGHEHHEHDHNLRAAYLHVVADAMTSVLAILALLGGAYLGWTALDPLVGIVAGAVILRWSWSLCRGSARVLLDAVPYGDLDERVRSTLEAIDDVRVADLHTWDLGPGRRGCVVSIYTSVPRPTAFYREKIQQLAPFAHLTVEIHRCEHAPAFGEHVHG